MSAELNNLLNRLDKVKDMPGGKWKAKCPAHSDKSPSLAIKFTDEGKILIKCWAGCAVENILSAVGLTFEDLYPPRIKSDYGKKSQVPHFNKSQAFDQLLHSALLLVITLNSLLDNPLQDKNFVKAEFSDADIDGIRQACAIVLAIQQETNSKCH